jgi:hypothetical protein
MTEKKPTLGQAIDQVLQALEPLEKREQETVLSTVSSFLDISVRPSAASRPPAPPGPISGQKQNVDEPSTAQTPLDIRSLKEQKQPDSAQQMACIVAYYLLEHASPEERKQAITTADLDRISSRRDSNCHRNWNMF